MYVAGIIVNDLPVDGGMGAEPEVAGVGPIEDIGRIATEGSFEGGKAISKSICWGIARCCSTVTSFGAWLADRREELVGGWEDRPCWKGRANFFISLQSFLQIDGGV